MKDVDKCLQRIEKLIETEQTNYEMAKHLMEMHDKNIEAYKASREILIDVKEMGL